MIDIWFTNAAIVKSILGDIHSYPLMINIHKNGLTLCVIISGIWCNDDNDNNDYQQWLLVEYHK